MAEIRRDRLLETGFIVRNGRAQPCQPVEALGKIRRGRRPRQLEHGMEAVLERALPGAFQGLVHGVSLTKFLWPASWAFALVLARAPPSAHLGPGQRVSTVIKPRKDRSWAFPKQSCVDTYRSHPRALPGLPSQEASGRDRSAPQALARVFRFFAKARNGLSRGGAAR